jgi:molybdopterin synthase catalytic subunit
MRAEVRETPLDPWAELTRYEAETLGGSGRYGATAVFVGTMRDTNDGDAVLGMTLEHYPRMTEAYLQRLAQEAHDRWPLLDALVLHRVGELLPGDPIVLVAAWSAHRAAALDACRYLIEELKHRAPFWKRERLVGGERWVEGNR